MNELLQQKLDGNASSSESAIPITGHVYSGSVQPSGRGRHVRGDIGPAQKDSTKHRYGGKIEITHDARAVSGNTTEQGFAASFLP
jgi:hypothetical protein